MVRVTAYIKYHYGTKFHFLVILMVTLQPTSIIGLVLGRKFSFPTYDFFLHANGQRETSYRCVL